MGGICYYIIMDNKICDDNHISENELKEKFFNNENVLKNNKDENFCKESYEKIKRQ